MKEIYLKVYLFFTMEKVLIDKTKLNQFLCRFLVKNLYEINLCYFSLWYHYKNLNKNRIN